MTRPLVLLAALVAVLALGSLAAAAFADELGRSLADESCEARARGDDALERRGEHAIDILCGKDTAAVGTLFVAPLQSTLSVESGARHAALERALDDTAAGARLAARL